MKTVERQPLGKKSVGGVSGEGAGSVDVRLAAQIVVEGCEFFPPPGIGRLVKGAGDIFRIDGRERQENRLYPVLTAFFLDRLHIFNDKVYGEIFRAQVVRSPHD